MISSASGRRCVVLSTISCNSSLVDRHPDLCSAQSPVGEMCVVIEAKEGDLMTKSCPKIVVARPPPGPPLDDDGLLGSKVEMSSLGTIPRFFGLGLDLDPSMSSIVLALGGRPFAIADADVCCDIDSGTLDLSYHDRIVELDVLR